jgi:hypothetical protein
MTNVPKNTVGLNGFAEEKVRGAKPRAKKKIVKIAVIM